MTLIIQIRINRIYLSNTALQFLYFLYFKQPNKLSTDVDFGPLYTRGSSFKPLLVIRTYNTKLLMAKLQEKMRKGVTSKYWVLASDVFALHTKCMSAEMHTTECLLNYDL